MELFLALFSSITYYPGPFRIGILIVELILFYILWRKIDTGQQFSILKKLSVFLVIDLVGRGISTVLAIAVVGQWVSANNILWIGFAGQEAGFQEPIVYLSQLIILVLAILVAAVAPDGNEIGSIKWFRLSKVSFAVLVCIGFVLPLFVTALLTQSIGAPRFQQTLGVLSKNPELCADDDYTCFRVLAEIKQDPSLCEKWKDTQVPYLNCALPAGADWPFLSSYCSDDGVYNTRCDKIGSISARRRIPEACYVGTLPAKDDIPYLLCLGKTASLEQCSDLPPVLDTVPSVLRFLLRESACAERPIASDADLVFESMFQIIQNGGRMNTPLIKERAAPLAPFITVERYLSYLVAHHPEINPREHAERFEFKGVVPTRQMHQQISTSSPQDISDPLIRSGNRAILSYTLKTKSYDPAISHRGVSFDYGEMPGCRMTNTTDIFTLETGDGTSYIADCRGAIDHIYPSFDTYQARYIRNGIILATAKVTPGCSVTTIGSLSYTPHEHDSESAMLGKVTGSLNVR
jgi:hypothetical protein